MADTQWNIEYLLATAVAYMRDVGMPNEADAIIELQRRAATQPADAALDDARAQKPVAYMHNKRADVIHTSVKSLLSDFAVNSGPESMLRPIDKSEHYTIPLYAAPVPAQPAAEQEAVAMDVSDSALLKAYTTETGKVLPHSWRPIFLDYARIGIKAALLSAADTEVKNG